jgi:transcriptional regulator with XRE-family HTH domain
MTTNEILRDYRLKLGLKQEYVAQCISVSQPVYSRIEAGSRDLRAYELEKLAELYKTKVDSFFKNAATGNDLQNRGLNTGADIRPT